MKKYISCFGLTFMLLSSLSAQINYAKKVNPFIGTGGHGHTYPGATLPHGMVQLSPDTRLEGWDGCGGYHYSDSYIYGFSHTHLSGTGIPDCADILVMPMSGRPSPDNKIYGSNFSHANEKAWAGYYSVLLDKGNIQTEFTATSRVGFHHYQFTGDDHTVILDLKHRDEVLESSLKIEDSFTVSGMRRSKSWAENQYVFFVMKFSKPIKNLGIWNNEQLVPAKTGDQLNSKNLKAFFEFDLSADKNLYVKVALSPVSTEGAKANLQAELPGWDFEKTRLAAEAAWNTELSKIEVKADDNKSSIFYTALYHTTVVPNINMDADGTYRGMDNKIHQAAGFNYYSVFSLWDTYRAAHPLYTIIDRKRTLDYIKTFLTMYKEGGRLPVWELSSNETECMIGYHSVAVIADAYAKGITGFDTKLALEAMVHSANMDHFGLKYYRTKGMIESDDEQESVSRTLEYAYDDYCIATFAKATGNEEVYKEFIKRAQYYKNVLDPETGFMRPRKNGDWLSPFDPKEVNNNYTEANSWQYSFLFPQDIKGYLSIIGNGHALEQKLDELFSTTSPTTGRDQSDITGLIGQYAQGNEPSHHIAYLYNFTDSAFKTQEKVRYIMNEFYKNSPDGLIGNEDCGQMSAWYVMSAMGIYQVTPGTDYFDAGLPAFDETVLHLENGKTTTITARNLNANAYIHHINLAAGNDDIGQTIKDGVIRYADLMNGSNIIFQMSDRRGRNYKETTTATEITAPDIVLNPVIRGGKMSFQNEKTVAVTSNDKNVKIYYTIDGTDPDQNKSLYKKPLKVNSSMTLKAIAYNDKGDHSFITTAVYMKMEHDWSVQLNTPYEQMYDGGGAEGLIDGIRGETNWRKGNWQGYQKVDMDVTIDLKQTTLVSSVMGSFLQDTRAWIVVPKEIIIQASDDGKNFTTIADMKTNKPIEDLEPQLWRAQPGFAPVKTRYIRLKALQYGKLPAWHEGAGGDTHIFIDEVEVR